MTDRPNSLRRLAYAINQVRMSLDVLEHELVSLDRIAQRFPAFDHFGEEITIGDNVSFVGRVRLTGASRLTSDVTGTILDVTEHWVHVQVIRQVGEDVIEGKIFLRKGRNLIKIGRHVNVTNF